jgi:hypothetical protein
METVTSQRIPPLHPYHDPGRHSAVAGYAVLPEGVAVEFNDGHVYLYTYDCPGRRHVEQMKALVDAGQRLGFYITRHVGRRYAAQLR